MTTSYVLSYTWPLMKRATVAYCWRVTGWRFVLAVGLAAAGAIGLALRGDRSWLVGSLALAASFGALIPVALLVQQWRQGRRMLRDSESAPITLVLSPAKFALSSSALGASELPWSRVKELWQYPGFWFLVLTPPRFVTLPDACLDPAGRALIEEAVRAAGGRVVRRGRAPAA
ncbi:MAG TPA: YcxB family protein [Thermoanaerobaculia bacterium]|jgi:hypothetical protein|nr:YcxB family protein [Thermoanaerobaculia bacterium]